MLLNALLSGRAAGAAPPIPQAPIAMRLRLLALAAVATLASAPVLSAQTTHFTFTNGGSVAVDGYYVGPYNGTMGPSATPVLLNCVDFIHHITNGESWDAFVTAVNAVPTSPAHTRSSDPIPYEKAAWLTTQYAGVSDPAVINNIQRTIWNLFQPAAAPDPTDGSYWLDRATAHYADIAADFGSYYVVTPANFLIDGKDNPNSTQEFIIHVTSTPEPASMTLLATGLVGIFGAARRKRQLRNG